jgi:chromosome segregation ATPase
MRKTVKWLVLAAAGWYVTTQTDFLSYAGTILSLVRKETKKASPTPLELARARHEIDNLDGDINKMVRPIAEHLAAIGRLKKDLQASQEQLDMQREVLLIMARDLEGNPTSLSYGDKAFTPDQVKKKLQRDYESFQRLEAQQQSQRKLLAAKETSLLATQEQLAKLMSKKREYEVRLAQLEAEEETLKIAKLGSTLQVDDSRATQIEAVLKEIEQRQDVTRAELELRSGAFVADPVINPRAPQALDPTRIRKRLEGGATVSRDR